MLKVQLSGPRKSGLLHTHDDENGDPSLVMTTYPRTHGVFASAVLTTAATYTVVEAKGNNGIILTDLLISAEKVAGGSLTVRFSDGVNNETIMLATVVDAPVNLAIPFVGLWRGWQACDLQVVTDQNIDGCVAVGYYRTLTKSTPTYTEWDAMR